MRWRLSWIERYPKPRLAGFPLRCNKLRGIIPRMEFSYLGFAR